MAKISTLTNNDGTPLYPITSTRAVFDEHGVDLETKLSNKVEKEQGKGLSTNDYTSQDKSKLDNLPTNEKLTSLLNNKQAVIENSDDVVISEGKLSLTDIAKRQLFIDLFNRLCDYNTYPKGDRLYKEYLVFGKYDPENAPDALHPFYLNKLWLTYEEAIDVVNAHNITDSTTEYLCRARTLLPKRGYTTQSLYRYGSCIMGLESLYIANYYIINNLADPEVYQQNVSSTRELGQYSHKLRMILGKIRITADAMSTHFYSCNFPALEIFWVGGVFNSFTMNAPKLRVECWRYMIDNAANTTAITITVPSSIYAKLTGDTTAQEFTDLSEDEQTQWLEILDIAISRNISFATI